MVQILDCPIHSIHFHFSLSSRQGEVSQFRETFSPKSPSRMTPEWIVVPGKMVIKKLFLCPQHRMMPGAYTGMGDFRINPDFQIENFQFKH